MQRNDKTPVCSTRYDVVIDEHLADGLKGIGKPAVFLAGVLIHFGFEMPFYVAEFLDVSLDAFVNRLKARCRGAVFPVSRSPLIKREVLF